MPSVARRPSRLAPALDHPTDTRRAGAARAVGDDDRYCYAPRFTPGSTPGSTPGVFIHAGPQVSPGTPVPLIVLSLTCLTLALSVPASVPGIPINALCSSVLRPDPPVFTCTMPAELPITSDT